jgi:hypothetical protein
MPRQTPEPRTARHHIGYILGLALLTPTIGCSSHTPQPIASQPQPAGPRANAGTVAAVRPVSSAQDPTGSLHQIMSILGQAAPQPADASEIVLRMPDNTVKTSVQAPQTTLAAGSRAAVTAGPIATIQPY